MGSAVNGANQIQQDFKIFLGKKAEIAVLEKQNKITPLKWYLAWNTGEIFIGMPNKKLRQFGGKYEEDTASDNLSYEELQELANEYFTKYDTVTDENIQITIAEKKSKYSLSDIALLKSALDTKLLKKQLASIQGDYKSINDALKPLQNKVDQLTERALHLIERHLQNVLNNLSDKFYTKSQIQAIINNTIEQNYTDYITTWANSAGYATQQWVKQQFMIASDKFITTDKLANKVSYTSGNNMTNILADGTKGVYIINESSPMFNSGDVINVLGVNKYTKLSISGGASSNAQNVGGNDPEIILTDANGNTEDLIEDGITELTKTLSYTVKNIGNVKYVLDINNNPSVKTYNFYSPNNEALLTNQNLSLNGTGDIDYNITIQYPSYGNYKYTMSVESAITNTRVDGVYTLYVRAPLFYGSSNKLELSDTEILAMNRDLDKTYSNKSYTINTNAMEYLYFIIPHYDTTEKFIFNGFNAPFDKVTTTYIKTRKYNNILYDVYRSSSALIAGEYEITIK